MIDNMLDLFGIVIATGMVVIFVLANLGKLK